MKTKMSSPSTDVTSRAYFDNLYAQVKGMIVTKSFNEGVVISMVTQAITIATSFKDLTGMQKKDLVVNAVTEVVNDLLNDTEVTANLPDTARAAILAVVNLVPTLVDNAIAVGKIVVAAKTANSAAPTVDDGVATKACCF